MFSSGVGFTVHGLFNICSRKQRSVRALNHAAATSHTRFWLTQGVCGPQGAGSGLLVGLAVAGGQRFGHGRGGAVGGVGGPAQGELQGGTLREALKRRQTLRTEAQRSLPAARRRRAASALLLPSETHTFPSRMVSQVALFLFAGHSSVSCMDTSYSPSSSCSRLHNNQA